jgi:GAF domain-containing protein
MTDQRTLLEVLERFAARLVTDYAVNDALHDLIDGATVALQLVGAGVSLADGDRLAYAAAEPDRLTPVEQAQERTQAGPCIDAYRCGTPVVVHDIHDQADRWPAVTEEAARSGLVAIAGVPMHLNGARLGALDLYDDRCRAWTDDEIGVATLLADMATAYIANAHRLDEARTTAEQLQHALDSRIVIEQAKGMLAAHHDISVDAAFVRLRSHARSHQVSLRSVAEGVVDLRLTI